MFYTCTRLRAIALGLVSLVLAPAVVTAQSSTPNTVEGFLNASEWFVEYEATFVVNHKWDTAYEVGTVTRTTTMTRVMNGSKKLDVRSGGPAMLTLMIASDPNFQKLSAVEQQAKLTPLIMRVDDIANWLGYGFAMNEDVSSEDQEDGGTLQLNTGTARLEYLQVEEGKRLYSEDDQSHYDYVDSTFYNGSGSIIPMEDIKLEIVGSAKRFLLTLTTALQDSAQASLKTWSHRIEMWDGVAEPIVSSQSRETNLGTFPQTITIDDSTSLFGSMPLIDSTFDPAKGKIVGEKTVDAHFTAKYGLDIPGKLTFKYTLTPKG